MRARLRTILGAIGGATLAATIAYAATTTLTLGTANGPGGIVVLEGSTSGSVTLQPPAVAGATTFTLPGTNGSNTNVLQTDGSGNTSWAAAGAASLTVGTSGITSGTNNRLFYDNAGVLGEAVVGSGLSLSGGNLTATGGGAATGVGVQAGQSPSNIGDNATALPAGHFYYGTNVAMTLPRTHALPDSATQGVGDIEIFDAQQTVTATNQLCAQAAGTDKLNGVTNGTVCITTAGGSLYLHNDAAGVYTTGAGANIPRPTDAQLILGKTGTPSDSLIAATMSQDCTITNAGVTTCTKTNNVSFGALATLIPGTNVATFLTTPTSANLAAALTDETGTGAAVFAGSPALTGTPTAPTATVGTNTTQLATTAFVIANAGGGGGGITTWTSYTPALTCLSGTLTTSSSTGHYVTNGNVTSINVTATITTAGSCDYVKVALPNTANFDAILVCKETAASGVTGSATIVTSGTTAIINPYSGVASATSGYKWVCSGTYENS